MEPIKVDINTLADVVTSIRAYQTERNSQRLDQILPIVLEVIKSKMHDMQEEIDKRNFFAPAWVGMLMAKLNNYERLSNEDYIIYRSLVAQLKPEDYKLCSDNILGYAVRYLSANGVRETVIALKKYFDLA